MMLRSFSPACMVPGLILPNSAWADLRLYVGAVNLAPQGPCWS